MITTPTRPLRLTLATFAAATLCATAAFALPSNAPGRFVTEVREGGEHGTFPMPAPTFRQRVSGRIEKARAHMEEHITEKQLTKDEADAKRANFTAAVAQINAKVDAVCADGTVTQPEADIVHELMRSLMHHEHHVR